MVNYFFLLPNFLNIGTETGKSDHFFFSWNKPKQRTKIQTNKISIAFDVCLHECEPQIKCYNNLKTGKNNEEKCF